MTTPTGQSSTSVIARSRTRKFLRWIERILACIGLCFVIWTLAFEMTAMTSGSMSPALKGTSYEDGDRIVLEKVTGWFRSPRRWEIHFFYNDEGVPVTKRIVGLPGERISIKNSRIYVNGQQIPVPEPLRYLKYLAAGNLAAGREVDCAKGYYVLGDDSGDSYDSRFTGPVEAERFRGRVWCVLWPKARIGIVE